MKQSLLEQQLSDVVRPVVEGMGFALVLLKFNNGALELLVENPETGKINIDECAEVSRAVSPALDVEDLIGGSYRLEVSSPGIDRPLTREQDYETYTGFEAKLEISPPIEGRKRYRGIIKGIENNAVTIHMDGELHSLPFGSIEKAKLVLSDELIKATQIQH